jgi:PH (Pleckstrin Homology) domain-containing protein
VLLGVVGMTVLGIVFTAESGDPRWLFASLPFALVLFVVGRLAPAGYRLAPDGVRVDRRAGPIVIPYRTIRSVDREPRRLGGVMLLGSRGVFGRFGRFWSPSLGVYRLYLTNREQVVWLTTERGLVGLSPDRPAEFVERLAARLGLLGRGPGR